MEQILNRIIAEPIHYAIAFLIFLIALTIFIRMAGNPVKYLTDKVFVLLPYVIKEFKGEAGKAGIVNIIIVFAVLLLAFLILYNPSILLDFTPGTNHKSSALLILIVAAVSFLISLVVVAALDYSTRILKK